MEIFNDDIDKNLYNEKSLYLLNVRELRDIGRKLGVPSPTTLSKQKLVDYILKMIYGDYEVPKHNSSGRPSVREFNINHYIEKIKKRSNLTTELKQAKLYDLDSSFKVAAHLNQRKDLKSVEQKIFVEEDGNYYLREYGFISSKNDLIVLPKVVEQYKLENFDVVEIIHSGSAYKIVTINGENVNKEKQKEKLNKQGVKQVFHLRTKEEIKKQILKLEKETKDKNLKLIVFSANKFSGENTHSVVVCENDEYPQIYKKFVSFTNYCEKFVFENQDIVVVTDCSDLIEQAINSFSKDVSERIKNHLQSQIEQLFELGNDLYVYKLEKTIIY